MNRSCFFSHAITPLQKTLCVFGGLSIFSVTGLAVVGGAHKWVEYIQSREYREKQMQRYAQGKDGFDKTIIRGFGAIGLAISTAGLVGCSVCAFRDINACRLAILGTTQCCDIVRKTLYTCARAPLYGGGIYMFTVVALSSIDQIKQ